VIINNGKIRVEFLRFISVYA